MIQKNNYAFIDSQNMNLAIRAQGWKLDLKKFRVYLSDKYSISKAYFFIGYVAGNEELYESIQEAGFICMFKPTMELLDGTVKGNVDAELVMYAVSQMSNYNQAVIVTGDGDFFCVAKFLFNRNKLLKILIPNQCKYSGLLKKIGRTHHNSIHFMNPLRDRLQLNLDK